MNPKPYPSFEQKATATGNALQTCSQKAPEQQAIRIALFFGSFNPVHIGHLAIANWMCETGHADEVWMVVSPQNPYKQQGDLMNETLRLEWVHRAVASYPRCRALDIEFSMPRPSYTIDTLDRLKQLYPQHRFNVIIGTDNWERFPGWKASKRIIDEFGLLVYPRRGSELTPDQLPTNVRLIDAPQIEVSSTFIREGLQNGKEYPFFVPQPIYQSVKEAYSRG